MAHNVCGNNAAPRRAMYDKFSREGGALSYLNNPLQMRERRFCACYVKCAATTCSREDLNCSEFKLLARNL